MRVLAFASLLLLAACSVPSAEDLSVSVSIEDANMTMTKTTLQSQATGSFIMILSLGPSASDASDVTVKGFQLVRQLDGASLATLGPTGALSKRVGVGVTEKISYTIDQPIDAQGAATICDAGPVKVFATIHDGARNRITTSESQAFTVVCK